MYCKRVEHVIQDKQRVDEDLGRNLTYTYKQKKKKVQKVEQDETVEGMILRKNNVNIRLSILRN